MLPIEIKDVIQRHAEVTLHTGMVFTGYICTWVDALDQTDENAGDAIVIIPDDGDMAGKRVELRLSQIASHRIIQKQTA